MLHFVGGNNLLISKTGNSEHFNFFSRTDDLFNRGRNIFQIVLHIYDSNAHFFVFLCIIHQYSLTQSFHFHFHCHTH